MKVFLSSLIGGFGGLVLFFILNYQHLLLVGQHKAGLIITMQLNQAVDTFMWGGAIIGALIALSNNKKV